jgi:uncharacterized membrane protein YeaQ/YmgE (transglycosylase-associated protein family)
MTLLYLVLFGLVVGLIARALFPGNQSLGWLGTAGLGMAGSLIGGPNEGFAWAGWVGSILGAMLLLGLSQLASRRT